MATRTLDRQQSRQQSAWLIPLALAVVAGAVEARVGVSDPVWFAAGLVGGVLWQLAYRRDLVDRLTFPAMVLTLSALAALLPGATFETDGSAAVFGVAVLAGLYWTEHYLRRRER